MPHVHSGDLQLKPKLANYKQSSLKAARWGMWDDQAYTINDIFRSADDKPFQKVLSNPAHVLFPRLPRKKELTYNLRSKAHQVILPNSSILQRLRTLFSLCYSNTHIDWYCTVHFLCNECYVRSYFLYMLFLLLWCKSYAYLIGLLKDILTYLLTMLSLLLVIAHGLYFVVAHSFLYFNQHF